MEHRCRYVRGRSEAKRPMGRRGAGAPHGETSAHAGRGGPGFFVGAGPGAPDLLTLRGAQAIATADVVIWASSLVDQRVLAHARQSAEIVDSAKLPMEGVLPYYERAAQQKLRVARVHSGDPSLWGAIQEQLEQCQTLGLDTEIVPGVSSFTAVAARIGRELTIPEVAQSVILTRLGGGKTPMPPGEQVAEFARHQTTMALFLSAARSGQLQDELLAGGYPPDTPCVVAYQVTWPDELIVPTALKDLAATIKERKLWKHTLVLVGPGLAAGGSRSHLYHPGHFHGFRKADRQARKQLREPPTGRRPVTQHDDPELREPDLPRTAKVRKQALRTGWTTGTCAAAAAKAATTALHTGEIQSHRGDRPAVRPRVRFASGRLHRDANAHSRGGRGQGRGRRPRRHARRAADRDGALAQRAGNRAGRRRGRGGGHQAGPRPGAGRPGHQPGPARDDHASRRRSRRPEQRGVQIVISVPDGEKMARKTTNARLGIIGGISILGTTGIVRPFSTASWRASVEQAISVLAAQGEDTVVLCTGGRTEKGAMKLLPHLPEVCFVEVGDFTGAALRRAVEHGLTRVIFAGMAGKLTKLAAGVLMTHYTRSKVSLELLKDITLAAGGGQDLAERVANANTARHAAELWDEAGLLPAAGRELCARAARVLRRFCAEQAAREHKTTPEIVVIMVDFTGQTKIAEAAA